MWKNMREKEAEPNIFLYYMLGEPDNQICAGG
jgi:hypothetical protein